MAVFNVPNYKTADGFGMSLNIRRGNPNPLDNSSVWSSYADALNYAQTSAVSYVGQLLAVVNAPEGEAKEHTVDVYKIELDAEGVGTLVKVGSDDEGVAELRATVDKLVTDLAATDTAVDTLTTDVDTLKTDVDAVEEAVAEHTTAIETATTDIADLKDATSTLTTKVDTLTTQAESFATKTEVATAKQEAIDAAVKTILTDGSANDSINDAYDTIKEIAEWITNDETASTELINRVKAIEDDYLKGADKTELQTAIDDLETFVGAIPEGAVSTTVIDYINEVVNALNVGQYAKASELSALADTVTELTGRVDLVEDELATRAKINSVDGTSLVLSETGVLSVGQVAPDAVVGLPAALTGKVDKLSTEYKGEQKDWILLSPENQEKLASLVIGDNGIEVSGKVNADNVEGLASWITTNKNTVEGLVSDKIVTDLAATINSVTLNGGTPLAVVDKAVDLPAATNTAFGVIKGTVATYEDGVITNPNTVSINDNGEMEVNAIDVSKLVQTTDAELILFGGSAATLK